MSRPEPLASSVQVQPLAGLAAAALSAALVGAIGGLIGLGGAEFRLPLLIALFGFAALEAVIVNKAISLIVVAAALIFRTKVVPIDVLLAHWPIVANLLAGSLAGAWLGADVATRIGSRALHRIIAVILVAMAAMLAFAHEPAVPSGPWVAGMTLIVLGAAAGLAIGLIAALLGVAGGELLIPTLVLLFGADIALAGSLSLAISMPTLIVGFARYGRDRSFQVLRCRRRLVVAMALGSAAGAFVGAWALQFVPHDALPPVLAVILIASAVKLWRHR